MKYWVLYNSKLNTLKRLTDKEMREVKKFYKINFPIWDEYYQKHDKNALANARGDMFLFARYESEDKG